MIVKFSKYLRVIFGILGISSLLSCVADLDLAPLGTQSVATYYNDAAEADAATISLYGQLRAMYSDEVIVTPNVVAADDGIPFLTGNADRVGLWRYDLIATNGFVGTIWANAYAAIQRSNTVAQRVSGIAMDAALKNQFIGEAKFLRALHYFTLVRFFGGVPLVLDETLSLKNVEVPRNSIDEVYDQVVKDLQFAATNLPASYPAVDIGRATRGAAKSLLAKVYLTRAGTQPQSPYWAVAAQEALDVIQSGTYDLWDSYADVFSLANRGGKESVFEVMYLTDRLGNNFTTGYAPRGAPIVPNNGSGIFRVSKSLFDLYETHDARLATTFLQQYTHPSSGTVINLSVDNPDPALAISFWKLADLTSRAGGQGGKSYPIMRFSDLLLTYAEAENEVNRQPTQAAYNALNRVRARAGLDVLDGLDYASFLDAVLDERRRELCFEGHRWFDLVRRGRLVDAVKAANTFNRNATIEDYHSLLPIPQRELDANRSLTQNFGY